MGRRESERPGRVGGEIGRADRVRGTGREEKKKTYKEEEKGRKRIFHEDPVLLP